ncbi:YetF domain-containing protein [Exiguobacterium sp. s141]|nr:YetF domain-containing protein [Exiguobacterium sp. s141]
MQYVMAKLATRSKRVNQLIKSTPALLYYDGTYLEETMRRERVLEIEVLQAIRSSGTDFDQVEAVVLETDGTFSVLTSTDTVLRNVQTKKTTRFR